MSQDNKHFTQEEIEAIDPELESLEGVIQLGFIDSSKEGRSEYGAFITKLGGFPVWLTPDQPACVDDLRCGICTKPLAFLMQIYTPEDIEEAYHRVLYVFVCKGNKCLSKDRKKSIKVIRSQLPKDNKYYFSEDKLVDNEEEEEEDSEFEDDEDWKLRPEIKITKECWVCHLEGTKRCSKCHIAQYCSREHQIMDWEMGTHKHDCGSIKEENIEKYKPKKNRAGFPEKYIDCEPEKSSEEMKLETLNRVEKLMQDINLNEVESKDSNALMKPGDEKYENTKVEVDQAFLAFQRRIEFDPSQVIRYTRTHYKEDNSDNEPLWVSDQNKPLPSDILLCQNCYNDRSFELQIMPQLLNHLPIDHTSSDALDWATYLIYSCQKCCWPPSEDSIDRLKNGYNNEVIIHQDFANDGIGENIRKHHFN